MGGGGSRWREGDQDDSHGKHRFRQPIATEGSGRIAQSERGTGTEDSGVLCKNKLARPTTKTPPPDNKLWGEFEDGVNTGV